MPSLHPTLTQEALMLDTPRLVTTDPQQTAVIAFTIARAEMPQVMGPGHRELMAVLAEQGLTPAGPWLTYHRRLDPDVFDFELAIPVATAVRASGRVRPGRVPAATVARATLRGSYDGLPAAWGELERWIERQGRRVRGDFWERYVAGPESSTDPTQWKTELNRALIG